MRMIARPRLGADDVSFTPVELFGAFEPEIERIGHFTHEFPSIFAILFFLRLSLGAILLGFVLPLFHQLLNLLLFFTSIMIRERLVIFRDEPLHLVAIKIHHLVGLYVGRLHTSFSIQPASLVAFHVRVVALFLVVFLVLLGDLADQLTNLILGKRRRSLLGCGARPDFQ